MYGNIDEYIRLVIRKYWVDKNDVKDTSCDPTLIKLNISNPDIIIDENYSSDEITVLYYTKILTTDEVAEYVDNIQIDPSVNNIYDIQETTGPDGYKEITTKRKYDGMKAWVEIEADGVQSNNAAAAIHSTWGVTPTIVDGVITEIN